MLLHLSIMQCLCMQRLSIKQCLCMQRLSIMQCLCMHMQSFITGLTQMLYGFAVVELAIPGQEATTYEALGTIASGACVVGGVLSIQAVTLLSTVACITPTFLSKPSTDFIANINADDVYAINSTVYNNDTSNNVMHLFPSCPASQVDLSGISPAKSAYGLDDLVRSGMEGVNVSGPILVYGASDASSNVVKTFNLSNGPFKFTRYLVALQIVSIISCVFVNQFFPRDRQQCLDWKQQNSERQGYKALGVTSLAIWMTLATVCCDGVDGFDVDMHIHACIA